MNFFRAWFKTSPDWEQEVRRRGRRALIFGIPAFLILAVSGAASLALVLFTLVAVGLYVPAWSHVRYGNWVIVVTVVVLVFLYPFYQVNLFELPIFGAFPSVDTGVTMLIYIMMALGLNIVVGYAGLLDLGYVAFYAMGAYTAAWFASQHFHQVTLHIGSVGVNPSAPGIHLSMWIVLAIAGIFTAIIGIIIGFPTLRLRGDYLAIVTLGFGEIMPQVARNGDHIFGQNITNGPQGINPIDPPGFGNTLHDATGVPADYLTFSTLVPQPHPHERGPLLLDGAPPRPLHCLLQRSSSRLAPREGVDRHPGGRDRRGGNGRPADAHEDLGLCGGRALRRDRRRVLRELQVRHVP